VGDADAVDEVGVVAVVVGVAAIVPVVDAAAVPVVGACDDDSAVPVVGGLAKAGSSAAHAGARPRAVTKIASSRPSHHPLVPRRLRVLRNTLRMMFSAIDDNGRCRSNIKGL
jgi:hypothetical protein